MNLSMIVIISIVDVYFGISILMIGKNKILGVLLLIVGLFIIIPSAGYIFDNFEGILYGVCIFLVWQVIELKCVNKKYKEIFKGRYK